jgi:hypothetical protein
MISIMMIINAPFYSVWINIRIYHPSRPRSAESERVTYTLYLLIIFPVENVSIFLI